MFVGLGCTKVASASPRVPLLRRGPGCAPRAPSIQQQRAGPREVQYGRRRRAALVVRASIEEEVQTVEADNDVQPENGAEAAAEEAAAPAPPAAAPAARGALARDSVDKEIFNIALPTMATLAADPIASLISTAWVGRLGSRELAAVGVALSVYNTITKLFNMPLLSVTTSTVASPLGEDKGHLGARVGGAVSAAIMLALLTGLLEAALLAVLGLAGLRVWGAGPSSPLHTNAAGYLAVRALSAPATVLFLTLQGVFRGLGDTRAPFYATLLANAANIVLEPLLIFGLGWGVRGAAGAIAVAQGLSCCVLLYLLRKRVRLQLAGRRAVRDTLDFLKPTGLLTLRTVSISTTFAVATSRVARTGAIHMAAHQVCFQVWLASSLLADSLAVSAQALLARALAAHDKQTGRMVVARTAQLALGLGLALMLALGAASPMWPRLFTRDAATLRVVSLLIPAVVATQPINALAFLFDGVLYGAGGFQYAAMGMVVAAIPALAVMLGGTHVVLGRGLGLDAQLLVVWAGLAVLMLARFLTISLPFSRRIGPFAQLAD